MLKGDQLGLSGVLLCFDFDETGTTDSMKSYSAELGACIPEKIEFRPGFLDFLRYAMDAEIKIAITTFQLGHNGGTAESGRKFVEQCLRLNGVSEGELAKIMIVAGRPYGMENKNWHIMQAMQRHQINSFKSIMLYDDSQRNCHLAREMGYFAKEVPLHQERKQFWQQELARVRDIQDFMGELSRYKRSGLEKFFSSLICYGLSFETVHELQELLDKMVKQEECFLELAPDDSLSYDQRPAAGWTPAVWVPPSAQELLGSSADESETDGVGSDGSPATTASVSTLGA